MPSLCGFTWSDYLDGIIKDRSYYHGVPLDLSYAIIAVETGGTFDPTIIGGHGCNVDEYSVGLLQLNMCGGQGTGYTVQQLQDPVTNLDIGLPYIRSAFLQCWSATIAQYDYIYCVCTNSGHPGPVAYNDPRIQRIFNIWQCFFNAIVAAAPPPYVSPLPPAQPIPPTQLPPPWPPYNPGGASGMSDVVVIALVAVAALAVTAIERPSIYKKILTPGGGLKKVIK